MVWEVAGEASNPGPYMCPTTWLIQGSDIDPAEEGYAYDLVAEWARKGWWVEHEWLGWKADEGVESGVGPGD